jgi:hypothetical protein
LLFLGFPIAGRRRIAWLACLLQKLRRGHSGSVTAHLIAGDARPQNNEANPRNEAEIELPLPSTGDALVGQRVIAMLVRGYGRHNGTVTEAVPGSDRCRICWDDGTSGRFLRSKISKCLEKQPRAVMRPLEAPLPNQTRPESTSAAASKRCEIIDISDSDCDSAEQPAPGKPGHADPPERQGGQPFPLPSLKRARDNSEGDASANFVTGEQCKRAKEVNEVLAQVLAAFACSWPLDAMEVLRGGFCTDRNWWHRWAMIDTPRVLQRTMSWI